MNRFAARLIAWQKNHGRRDLPWQNTRDPYRIWLSEIMLQQTQVATVIPYYTRFLARFPDIATLAQAPLEEVLALWSGLGYYARARNLQRAAQIVLASHGGIFPGESDAISALPGIGRSTAAAISVFAYGRRAAILDGNVKRVLARYFGIGGYPGERAVEERLWNQAQTLLPHSEIACYSQGLMDLGATLCTRGKANCGACPLGADCAALAQDMVAQLPAAKPRKELPQKQTTMLVLLRRGEVLLEKRPPSGIWGGLWSLPELPPAADSDIYCARHFGAQVTALAALPRINHSFTHFKLAITPRPFLVTALEARAQQPGCLWLNREDALGAAIPTPVRRILQSVAT